MHQQRRADREVGGPPQVVARRPVVVLAVDVDHRQRLRPGRAQLGAALGRSAEPRARPRRRGCCARSGRGWPRRRTSRRRRTGRSRSPARRRRARGGPARRSSGPDGCRSRRSTPSAGTSAAASHSARPCARVSQPGTVSASDQASSNSSGTWCRMPACRFQRRAVLPTTCAVRRRRARARRPARSSTTALSAARRRCARPAPTCRSRTAGRVQGRGRRREVLDRPAEEVERHAAALLARLPVRPARPARLRPGEHQPGRSPPPTPTGPAPTR